MNRLILVGNGFDIALKLRSSYKQFIEQLMIKTCKVYEEDFSDYNDKLLIKHSISNTSILKYNTSNIPDIKSFVENEDIEIKSKILNLTILDIERKGWADIEKIYFDLLLDIYNIIKLKNQDSLRVEVFEEDRKEIKQLNNELSEIKKELVIHLQNEENKYFSKTKYPPYTCKKFLHPFIEEDFDDFTWKEFDLEGKKPIKTCILNFNYTNPFKLCRNDDLVKINVHGRLEDNLESIVFGYGDESDERYKEFKMLDENLFLENMKSFAYIRSTEYNKMLSFIESGNFQIFIVGHSCAITDKTLLNEIFESDFCKNIKIFYHEKQENGVTTDNFNEISFNISRLMDNSSKLRKVVAKKYLGCKFNTIL